MASRFGQELTPSLALPHRRKQRFLVAVAVTVTLWGRKSRSGSKGTSLEAFWQDMVGSVVGHQVAYLGWQVPRYGPLPFRLPDRVGAGGIEWGHYWGLVDC